MSAKQATPTIELHPPVLLLGVYAPFNKVKIAQDYYDEFLSLVKTAGIYYKETLFIKLRHTDPSYFLSKGKLEEVAEFCRQHEIEKIICSEILSPMQERNLEDFMNVDIVDREQLILQIFENAAHTAEGKIQVEMAKFQHYKARLTGRGIDLAQQAGHVGTKGPGETMKEVIKRHLTEKFRQAKKKLDTLERSRDVQRKQRLASNVPLVCIIGYTNAGKSTVLNTLTKSHVLVEDKLFATLDTTTRELFINAKKIGLISDTVGFISQLPHHLIQAFKSTLDELRYANLLLHVVDASNAAWHDQVDVVSDTLDDMGVPHHKNMLFVFNKIDCLTKDELKQLKEQAEHYQPHVFISAKSKEGLTELVQYLGEYKFGKE